jgi:hypothetical protein
MTEFFPGNKCSNDGCFPEVIDLFEATLLEACDEKPLQLFLASHCNLLSCLLPPGESMWCFDRPRFGGEFIPDFLVVTRNSTGFQWVMIELESPTKSPLTKAGLPTAKLNEALTQVRDWRSWLRLNIAYAQNQLGLSDLHAEAHAYVVIGRRSMLEVKHIRRYQELSTDKTGVMSYDRLLDTIKSGRTFLAAGSI